MTTSKREFDIVFFGATGFTGRLAVEYMDRRHASDPNLRWAIAGRNQAKLDSLRASLTGSPPTVLADTRAPDELRALAARTRVLCTTVGPYAKYGSEVVAACVAEGTDYCDLTGEVHWMHAMIRAHQGAAERTGARIVHCCGFDCIPSDLGTLFVQNAMRERHGVAAIHVKCRVVATKGGPSGGTIASAVNMMEQARTDPEVTAVMANPYALNPPDAPTGPDGPDQRDARLDPDFRQWTGPFVMAGVNTRVVRRSHALMGHPYGPRFRYDEAVLTGAGVQGRLRATALAASTTMAMAVLAARPMRALVMPLLPDPGEGPSEQVRENGFFKLDLMALHPTDGARSVRATVRGDRDPGYGSTAKMLAESALCLAQDNVKVDGGFWTPASALGTALIERLQANAGVTFTLS